MIDFITTYMPAYAELDPNDVRATRERLEKFIRVSFPDLDINPNTVVGDLIVTPQAFTIAAVEEGMDRFMSDLNLGNVADGVIFNCDFVEKYLGNFAAYRTANLRASGVVRLEFSENKDYYLDRRIRFSLGDEIFSIYLPYPGEFHICQVGATREQNENGVTLKDTGSGTFFADVPVVGNTGDVEITAGTRGLISTDEFSELMSIHALDDFNSGNETVTLPELAKRTRETIYAASMNTRQSAIRYVYDMCPFVEGAYAVKNGDREMLRDYHNPYGISAGCVDIYVRSKSYDFTEEQTLKLYYNADTDCFEGEFPYTGQIYHFESVTNAAVPHVADLPHTIISTNDAGIGALAAYTEKEKLFIAVSNYPEDTNAAPSVNNSAYDVNSDDNGEQYAMFTLRYQTDPLQQSIAQTVEGPDFEPVNTSVMVRGFIPIIIDSFDVVYVKNPGVVPLLDEAEASIKAYLASITYGSAFSEAEIADIMRIAGVKYMKRIRVRARVQWSVGDAIGTYDNDNNPKDFSTLVRVSDNEHAAQYTGINTQTAVASINSSEGLRLMYPGSGSSLTPDSMFACSIRNVRYYLMENALTFSEVVEHDADMWEV